MISVVLMRWAEKGLAGSRKLAHGDGAGELGERWSGGMGSASVTALRRGDLSRLD